MGIFAHELALLVGAVYVNIYPRLKVDTRLVGAYGLDSRSGALCFADAVFRTGVYI